MKAILKAESPASCQLIANGKKTILLSKTCPKLETPFKGYIYCTKGTSYHRHILWGDEYRKLSKDLLVIVPKSGDICFIEQPIINEEYRCNIINGKVIGEFVCDKMDTYLYGAITRNEYWINGRELEQTCMNYDELQAYGNGETLYGLHISDLKIYDKPKELWNFRGYCPKKNECYADIIRHCNVWKCNQITRPPRSWCYVEELKNEF